MNSRHAPDDMLESMIEDLRKLARKEIASRTLGKTGRRESSTAFRDAAFRLYPDDRELLRRFTGALFAQEFNRIRRYIEGGP
jgi:hypothetical protein